MSKIPTTLFKHGAKAIVGKDTVAGYLQRWLNDDIAINRAAKTLSTCEQTIRLHIVPLIGSGKVTQLDGEKLIAWQGKLARKALKMMLSPKCRP